MPSSVYNAAVPRPNASQPDLVQLLSQLLEEHHHLTVAQFEHELSQQQRKYNKTSIYRALDKMLAANLVCRHQLSDHEALYELRQHHHAHLVCQHCGQVWEGPCEYHHPETVNGFVVDHHHLTLVGTCQACYTSLTPGS